MCTTEEKFFTPLSAAEYRLLDVLCLLSENSKVSATTKELAQFAQTSEESIRRALRGLESANLVETVRSKRNLGKFHTNSYTLISPSHKNVGWQVEPSHKNVGSTAVPVSSIVDTVVLQPVPVTTNKLDKTTSYLGADARKGRGRKAILVNRWSDDDDDIAGFGLFDNELPASKKPPVASKRKPKTRNLRPVSDWTAADVASEFASRSYAAVPGVPNLIDTDRVRGAISKIRKEYDSTPELELKIMDIFFEDPWIHRNGKDQPQFIAGRFLKMFSTHFNEALRSLGLPETDSPTETDMSDAPRAEFVYASDGRRFDNSMAGRAALTKYEAKLRRNNGLQSASSS